MTDIKKRMYQAQCLGNIEPIEHMVPYPNLRALVDGQNVKYGEKMVYADLGLTSDKVYRLAQQTANWLVSEGVKPKDRILMDQLPFPQCEILAFGIWTLGASLVLTGDGDLNGAKKSAAPVLTITGESNYFKKINSFSKFEKFNLKFSTLRNYYYNNTLCFGDNLHKIHPMAGQGFNMTLRDIKIFSSLIDCKLDLGLPLDTSILKDFENEGGTSKTHSPKSQSFFRKIKEVWDDLT